MHPRWQHRYWTSLFMSYAIAIGLVVIVFSPPDLHTIALVTMLVGTSTVTVVTQIVEKVSDRQHPLARLERILKAAGIETPNLYCGNQLAEVKKGEVVFLPPGAIWFSKAKDCHFARTQLILHPEALPAQFFVVMGLDTGNTDWAVWWIGSNDPQFGTIHKNEPNVRVTWGGILNWQPK